MINLSEKYIGLSKEELSLLICVYGINNFVCFSESENAEKEQQMSQEEYNRTLVSLYQKNLIELQHADFQIKEETGRMFQLIKNAIAVVVVKSKEEMVENLLFYVGNSEEVLLLRSGKRENEYVRLQRTNLRQVLRLLGEADFLPKGSLSEQLLAVKSTDECRKYVETCLEDNPDIRGTHLWNLQEVKSILEILIPADLTIRAAVAIYHLPLEDEIIFCTEEEMVVNTYSENCMYEMIKKGIEIQ